MLLMPLDHWLLRYHRTPATALVSMGHLVTECLGLPFCVQGPLPLNLSITSGGLKKKKKSLVII